MKTKELVLCVLFSLLLCLADGIFAADAELNTGFVVSDYDVYVADSYIPDEFVVAASHNGEVDCAREPFWFSSAEALFLDVNADTGGRITLSFDDSGTAGTEIAFDSGTGFSNYSSAPRLTLGRSFGEKWGIAGRYFTLDNSTTAPPRRVPGTTPLTTFGTYTENDIVKMYSLDLEGIRSFQIGKTKFDASLGGRHASIDVDSELLSFGVITTGNFVNLFLANGCAFDGSGITGQLALRRQIGDSPVEIFIAGRASKLWGFTDSYGRAAGAVASSPSAPLVGAATVTRNNTESDLVIGEFQAGVQFEYELHRVPVRAFFRAAFEYQNWDINGPPTGGAGFGGTLGTLTTNSFSRAGLGDTELIGAAIATGFSW